MDDTKFSSWFLSATHVKDLFGVQKFSETIPSKSETKSKFEPYITGSHKERVPTIQCATFVGNSYQTFGLATDKTYQTKLNLTGLNENNDFLYNKC